MKTKLDLDSPEDRIILAECMVQPLLRTIEYTSIFWRLKRVELINQIETEEILLYDYLFFHQQDKIEKNKRKVKNSIMELEV